MGGGHHCCVYGCKSRRKGISYYKFPTRPWERQRRKEWITAVRRCHPMGKKWEPTKHSVICCLHFEGGKKMEDPRLNSYTPTIFPPCFKKKAAVSNNDNQEIRNDIITEILQYEENAILEDYKVNGCPSIGIQTKPINELMSHNDGVSTHYVWNDSLNNEASTQTYVAPPQISQSNKSKIIVVAQLPTVRKKTNAELEEVNAPGFRGYSEKIEELDMKELSGVSLPMFQTLLMFLFQTEQSQLCKTLNTENRLLLFLMKMKLGLAFSTIGLFFKVSSTVALEIFESILDTIYENTKPWVKWPSRELIKEEVPFTFKNYPKCLSLIDFVEIRTKSPVSASIYIIKFLIAINPSESVIFLSKGYGGGTSNEFILNDSGFIDLVEAGDEIMASKECPEIKSELFKKQTFLITPPFSSDPDLDIVEGSPIEETHIDQALQKLKKFKIIDHVDFELISKIDKIMHVICAISK